MEEIVAFSMIGVSLLIGTGALLALAGLDDRKKGCPQQLVIDTKTDAALREMMPAYGAETRADLIRRALALSLVFARAADDKGHVTIVRPDKTRAVVALRS